MVTVTVAADCVLMMVLLVLLTIIERKRQSLVQEAIEWIALYFAYYCRKGHMLLDQFRFYYWHDDSMQLILIEIMEFQASNENDS